VQYGLRLRTRAIRFIVCSVWIPAITSYSFAVACPQVFFMLCGLSLELMFKASILEIGKTPPTIHNLRKLSSLAQLTMSADDLELIDLLSNHISWAGKYPIPKGGKKEWKEHTNRMHAALFDRVPNTSIAIMRQNERLNWGDYSRIWEIGSTRYWALYHQHKP
jgi:hypothetical protein